MSNVVRKAILSGGIVTLFLFVDQAIKVWIKTHMFLHESIRVTNWFYILFTENNGMAFGMELVAKPVLSLFRIVAVGFIAFYLVRFIRRNLPWGVIILVSLVMVGAIGNIFDCVFYGTIFSESSHAQIASLVPLGQGYSTWMLGRVVDMFYFPLVEFDWPSWMPFVGGDHFIFFSPIFNFADACISTGVIALFLFYNRYLTKAYLSLKS